MADLKIRKYRRTSRVANPVQGGSPAVDQARGAAAVAAVKKERAHKKFMRTVDTATNAVLVATQAGSQYSSWKKSKSREKPEGFDNANEVMMTIYASDPENLKEGKSMAGEGWNALKNAEGLERLSSALGRRVTAEDVDNFQRFGSANANYVAAEKRLYANNFKRRLSKTDLFTIQDGIPAYSAEAEKKLRAEFSNASRYIPEAQIEEMLDQRVRAAFQAQVVDAVEGGTMSLKAANEAAESLHAAGEMTADELSQMKKAIGNGQIAYITRANQLQAARNAMNVRKATGTEEFGYSGRAQVESDKLGGMLEEFDAGAADGRAPLPEAFEKLDDQISTIRDPGVRKAARRAQAERVENVKASVFGSKYKVPPPGLGPLAPTVTANTPDSVYSNEVGQEVYRRMAQIVPGWRHMKPEARQQMVEGRFVEFKKSYGAVGFPGKRGEGPLVDFLNEYSQTFEAAGMSSEQLGSLIFDADPAQIEKARKGVIEKVPASDNRVYFREGYGVKPPLVLKSEETRGFWDSVFEPRNETFMENLPLSARAPIKLVAKYWELATGGIQQKWRDTMKYANQKGEK